MKKKYILLITLLLILSFFAKSDNNTFIVDGIKYAVSVNGTEQASFPSKGSYTVTTSCTNADSKWNYQKWVAEIYNITGSATCNISFTQTTKITLASKITGLLGGSTSIASESKIGNGSTLEIVQSPLSTSGTSTDYRYRGVNPANYVIFNDELWRIIGVFDSNTHNVKDSSDNNINLVKIIRNNSIGGYVWDNAGSKGSNSYVNSDIYKLLNNAYYNTTSEEAEPLDATGEDYCYANSTSLPGKCDFTKIGIQPEYKKMIEDNATWYLGGKSGSDTSSNFYKSEKTSTSVVAPIGLMYVSDYGYAAPINCDSTGTSQLHANNTELGTTCASKDWLNTSSYEWTITKNTSSSSYVMSVNSAGYITYGYGSDAYNGFAVRPVLYLDSSVYYLSGTGSQTDPYIIAMD